ncbi:hypothetical protein [Burkholderia pyrrocinia]|uniref:hypothetical protein n=1 Tax=Burkholderia pyrrocinia TaxID=60550 RepID=UPI001ABA9C74|nr:hypothetical protein [Burkholderia pyrrocinia]
MRNAALTYRFPMLCSTLVLLACSNLARAEYREQWLGKTEIQRESNVHHSGLPKLAHGDRTPALDREHASPVSIQTARPSADDDPIAAFAETSRKPGAATPHKAKAPRVSS